MLGEIDKHNATVEVTDKIITSVELEKGKSELGSLDTYLFLKGPIPSILVVHFTSLIKSL